LQKRGEGQKVLAFIQARTGSKRFPNKIYADINGQTMISHVISRVKQSKLVNDVIVVSPTPLHLPEGTKSFVYSGPEDDVLGRYIAALNEYPCDYVVRITADCPLIDPNLIDRIVYETFGYDYGSNVLVLTFPDGVDTEVISAKTLRRLNDEVKEAHLREHVTLSLRENPFIQSELKLVSVESTKDYSYIKISVDHEEDLERVRKLMEDGCLTAR